MMVVGFARTSRFPDTAIGAEAPDRLVLEARGDITALFIVVHLGTFDHASLVADVARIAFRLTITSCMVSPHIF